MCRSAFERASGAGAGRTDRTWNAYREIIPWRTLDVAKTAQQMVHRNVEGAPALLEEPWSGLRKPELVMDTQRSRCSSRMASISPRGLLGPNARSKRVRCPAAQGRSCQVQHNHNGGMWKGRLWLGCKKCNTKARRQCDGVHG